jgi:unsaturated rhamnogalacturonyl hydrolase
MKNIIFKIFKINIIFCSKFLVLFMFIISAQYCTDKKSDFGSSKSKKIIHDSLSWAEKMADSEMQRRKNSLVFDKNNLRARWNYETGLFLKALLDLHKSTGHVKYFVYSKNIIDSYLDNDGSIKTYSMDEYNMDKINSGKVLLTLFKKTGDQKYKNAAGLLRQQLKNQPRTKAGGFWHKKRYPWQMWLDGIYMGIPFYAEYSSIINEPKGFDDAIKQILLIDVQTRDPETKLRYHGWDESNKQKWANPENGCSPNFWGRAMGWYAMALVDVLDFIPTDHPKREKVIFVLNDLCKALINYQDSETGVWYQIIDQGERRGNYIEASASCMFVYALAKAVQKDYIDPSFWDAAQKGYDGIIKNFIEIESNGLINLTNICRVAGLGGNPYRDGSYDYYVSEPVVKNDLKGVGPFIMASIQMDQ